MRTEQLTKCSDPLPAEDEVRYPLNLFKPPLLFYGTDCSKAVILIWLSVFSCFDVSFRTVFTFYVSR